MTQEAIQKVDAVLANVALFRRMPVRVIPCDPDLYLFLVRHPMSSSTFGTCSS